MDELHGHDPAVPITEWLGRPLGCDMTSIGGVAAVVRDGSRLTLLGDDGSRLVLQLAVHSRTLREAWFIDRYAASTGPGG